MPTKRSRTARTMRSRVSVWARQAYRERDELALHQELRLKPWEASPLHDECPYPPKTAYAASWAKSRELRQDLERVD